MAGLKEYSPIEVTTHNLYFHEEASVFTMHSNGRFIATGGGDKDIRLWTLEKDSPKNKEFCYSTAVSTSVRLRYHSVLSGHKRGVNCARFCGDLLASCSDGGEVIVWSNGVANVVRRPDGDDAYEVVWGAGHLFVGFSSGNISVFRIAAEGLSGGDGRGVSAVQVQRIKCHNDVIQGLAFNDSFGLLTSLSKDRTGRTFVFTDKLTQIEHMEYLDKDRLFSAGRGFFRRLSYSPDGRLLYLVCCHSNTVVVLQYPFRMEHVYARIGPLNSEPLRIICDGERLFVVTRKSLYLFVRQMLVFCVDNISFMAVTDGCVVDGVCFLSSLDGFLASLRMGE